MSDLAQTTEPAVPSIPLPFGFGPVVDQILPAIEEIVSSFYSPHRNKHVSFTNKKNQRVDFRFTTYSALNDLLREPLRQQGLFFMHFPQMHPSGKAVLVSRLIHKSSGQYCYCVQPLIADGGMQEYGSSRTFACRYAILSLLNICGDEDDDANAADGNIIHSSNELDDAKRTKRNRYEELVHLANTCRAVDDAPMAAKVLRRWNHDRDEYLSMPRIEGQQHKWPVLVRAIVSALERVHGPVIARAWRAAIEATSQDAFDELRRSWEGEWKRDVERMRSESDQGYQELGAHMKGMGVRLLELIEQGLTPGLVIEQPAQQAAAETAPEDAQGIPTASPAGLAREESPKVDQQAEPAPNSDGYFVLDASGDPVDDPTNDPQAWVDLYLDGLRMSDDRAAMIAHNKVALEWASKSGPALAMLAPKRQDAAPAAAPVPEQAEAAQGILVRPVPVPTKPRGTPDLVGYIRALKVAAAEHERGTIREWYDVQKGVFATLGEGVRMQALTVCEARIKQLEGAAA